MSELVSAINRWLNASNRQSTISDIGYALRAGCPITWIVVSPTIGLEQVPEMLDGAINLLYLLHQLIPDTPNADVVVCLMCAAGYNLEQPAYRGGPTVAAVTGWPQWEEASRQLSNTTIGWLACLLDKPELTGWGSQICIADVCTRASMPTIALMQYALLHKAYKVLAAGITSGPAYDASTLNSLYDLCTDKHAWHMLFPLAKPSVSAQLLAVTRFAVEDPMEFAVLFPNLSTTGKPAILGESSMQLTLVADVPVDATQYNSVVNRKMYLHNGVETLCPAPELTLISARRNTLKRLGLLPEPDIDVGLQVVPGVTVYGTQQLVSRLQRLFPGVDLSAIWQPWIQAHPRGSTIHPQLQPAYLAAEILELLAELSVGERVTWINEYAKLATAATAATAAATETSTNTPCPVAHS